MGAPAKGRKGDGLTATHKSRESHRACRAVAWRRRVPSLRRADALSTGQLTAS